jgi:hypothetical protein
MAKAKSRTKLKNAKDEFIVTSLDWEGGVTEVACYIKADNRLASTVTSRIWQAVRNQYALPCRWTSAIFTGQVYVYCTPDMAAEVRAFVESVVREL